MASLEPLMTVNVTLQMIPLGNTPAGTRLDVPFSGTATSDRWDRELAVEGVDYVTVGKGGIANLDIRARMGEGEDVVSYAASGRMGPEGILEAFTFQTASEKFADLNTAVAVAVGTQDKNKLTLEVFAVKR